MGFANRRHDDYRVPLQMFLNEYVNDDPYHCMSFNLSPNGIYLNHLRQPVERLLQPVPETQVVGLEFELPGTSEVVWACGEVRFDAMDDYFHGTGVQFRGMARKHKNLVRDYVTESRTKRLRKLLASIRRNRMH